MSQAPLKESPNRQSILQCLGKTNGEHLSATTVHHRLAAKGHRMALSTTYSNLDALSQAGTIGEVYSTQGERLFERRAEPHHHLLCKRCGKVQDLAANALSKACLRGLEGQAGAVGWRLEPLQLTLVGHCPECDEAPQLSTDKQPNKGAL